ncbi:MAG TPA: FGGY family carbohydrate kinase [Devosia sp.]|nr:FGGY family carbohydrate kinase [Devosia sp.]
MRKIVLFALEDTISDGKGPGYGLLGAAVAATTLIGIDVGTTAVKAVLLDAAGLRLGEFSRPHAMSRPEPGAAEQDPREWMAGVMAALEGFAAQFDLAGLAGIGLCSQVNTHVFLDAAGEPVRPAITWQDSRPGADAAALDARVTADEKIAWFGGPLPIDASHALSRMAWIARTAPGDFARTRHVLLPKDYCVFRLTGEIASDPISAVGLVDRGGYIAPLLELVPRAAELLPPLHPFHHIVGRVKPGLPGAGTPVVVGAMDAWGGMFGVGVAAEGEAMYQSGTSEIPGVVSAKVRPTPGVILFPPYNGIVMHAAPTQSGGASVAWLGAMLGKSLAELGTLAGMIEPSDAVPLFLPHLQGERAPLWDSSSRGAFARLDPRAGAPEMARAVMEGVAFAVRLAFGALEASAGRSIDVANIGGGGSRSDVWCQIRADALGFALRRTAVPDAAALGAAILAGVGTGIVPSLRAAVSQLVRFDRTFEPNGARRGYYDDKFAHYRQLYDALKPFNATYRG